MNVNELENRIEKLEQLIASSTLELNNTTTLKVGGDFATLGQNIPNPFSGITTIPYHVTTGAAASIMFIDQKGNVLKTIALNTDANSIDVETQNLPAGVYTYRLINNGKNVASKQMIVIK